VRGFGGFFFDAQARPVIYLSHPGDRSKVERALAPYLATQRISPSQLQVRHGDFAYADLERWSAQVTANVLGLPGGVFVDADEASNRVRIGVQRGAVEGIRGAVARLGLPTGAVIIQETEPIRRVATLQV
jgi:hypothetical protein